MYTRYDIHDLKPRGAMASTEHDGGYIASNVIDHNLIMGWAPWELPYVNNPTFRPEVSMDQRRISWVQVDLGGEHLITQVDLVTRQDGTFDGENTRRNFEIWGSNYEHMTEENSVCLGEQGDTPVTPKETWSCLVEPDLRGPYRYIRATKTRQDPPTTPNDTPWDFFVAELKVKGVKVE